MNREEREALQDLIAETVENLAKLETEFIIIEKQFIDSGKVEDENINSIFRLFHTIKGSSGFHNLPTVVSVAHEAESFLDTLRKNSDAFSREITDLLIETKDFLTQVFSSIEENGSDSGYEEVSAELIKKLSEKRSKTIEYISGVKKEKTEPKSSRFGLFDEEEPPVQQKKQIVLDDFENKEPVKNTKFGLFEDEEPAEKNESAASLKKAAPDEVKPAQKQEVKSNQSFPDIRISVDKLDRLLDLIGELVISESQVMQNALSLEGEIKGNAKLENWKKSSSHLHKIVRNLQETTLSLRMVPLTGVFRKMERLIRDLMRQTNKEVELIISGESTEIDKSMVELIVDPLVHILRNAIDHGIEKPEDRIKKGKPARGKILLSAAHAGKEVWISIQDDGRGLNRNKILEKAHEKNLLDISGDSLSDNEVWDFIFQPGFSTASEVTGISGRGVGMDVVKKNISKIGGSISIESNPDYGTVFDLKIPLTLAIIDGMTVKFAGRYFIIPSIDVQETVNIKEVQVYSVDNGVRVMKYRDRLIPVIRLDDFMNMKNKTNPEDSKYIVIIEFEGKCIGVVFDDILGNQSIVIKPLSEIFQKVKGISGCTILGNGIVGMILDVNYLVEKFYIKESALKKASN